ncbi:hypothetical protein [Klenkia sp. PcliD-1-E]|uniref:hypothetical protein n=1 Tax=Klenkia sp. PcliD-1-E TaxID=2954492 RepID=UPI002096EFC6|nr:hypothetical protein [Klenkia sp. PcliD-1-E]MCO7222496.1 hypothetical protein [Klenkia sp. PcliD-1-E]
MALLLRYELESRTASAVTYRWGTDQGELTWTVTLDPSDPETPPTGDGDPRTRGKVAGRVALRAIREGDWPTRGAIQS